MKNILFTVILLLLFATVAQAHHVPHYGPPHYYVPSYGPYAPYGYHYVPYNYFYYGPAYPVYPYPYSVYPRPYGGVIIQMPMGVMR